jgi:uncharacterized membrane protein YbhN (UPF0104 family)
MWELVMLHWMRMIFLKNRELPFRISDDALRVIRYSILFLSFLLSFLSLLLTFHRYHTARKYAGDKYPYGFWGF